MKREPAEVTAARVEAERARARMMDKAHALQARLNPKTIAQNAWEDAKDKGSGLAEEAVDAVRERPLAASGFAAAVGIFLARKPLRKLAGKLMGRNRSEGDVIVSESELANLETTNGYYSGELTAADPVRNPGRY